MEIRNNTDASCLAFGILEILRSLKIKELDNYSLFWVYRKTVPFFSEEVKETEDTRVGMPIQ